LLFFHPGTIGSSPEIFERANPSLKKFRIDDYGSDSLFGRKDGVKKVFLSDFYSFE